MLVRSLKPGKSWNEAGKGKRTVIQAWTFPGFLLVENKKNEMNTKIAIGNDHAGYELKLKLIEWLEGQGYQVQNFVTNSTDSVDYPDYVHPVAKAVDKGEYRFGILICGSGQGASFTANKHQGIRATLCWDPKIAKLAREHNNANILCLPGRFISGEEGIAILTSFWNRVSKGGDTKIGLARFQFDLLA